MAVLELPLGSERWAQFVRSRPDALPFHHPAWALLLAECYGFRSFGFALADEAGRLEAGLPVLEVKRPLGRPRWVSLPFTDTCPALVDPVVSDRLAAELDGLRQARGVSRVELRGPLPGAARDPGPAPLAHVLRLDPDADEVARRFKGAVLRNVRKSARSGLVIRRGESEGDLAGTFYDLLVDTRRRLGAIVQPRRFFRLLWRRALAGDLGFVLLAFVGETPVAGAVFLTWNGTVTYKYGASDTRYWDRRPNNLLFWEAIQWACANGYGALDFGRTDATAEGLRRFKLGWGCDESPLAYSAIGTAASGSRSDASERLSPVIRRAPGWLNRAIGRLLYKYAA